MKDTSFDLAIRGNLVLPEGKLIHNGIVAVRDGRIAAILEGSETLDAKKYVDASGKWILPGAVDAHVHCYSEPREGITGATRSAAAGGVTTIIEMPYDADEPVWTAELLEKKKKRVNQEACVDVALLATIRPSGGLDEIPRLAEAGACGFKLSTFNTHSYRFPRINDGEMLAAFAAIAEQGKAVGLHAENDEIVRSVSAQYEQTDGDDPLFHCKARPPVAESVAVATALELASWTGVHVHFHHTTVPRAVRLANAYLNEGVPVTVETCIQYLTFTEEDMRQHGARAKVNPPLRTLQDQEQLWEQCRNGQIGIVTSDHAPWQLDKKSKSNIFENSSGAPGVETLLPVLYSEGVAKGKISIHDLVRLLCMNPARIYGFSDRKGSLAVGSDADIVILDPYANWQLNETEQHSFAGWSLFHGKHMEGKITATYVRGQEVYDGQKVREQLIGKFVEPRHRSLLTLSPLKEAVTIG